MKGFKSKKKIINYQKVELERLQKNLKLLSKGNLDFDLNVSQGDNNTKEERVSFLSINEDLLQIRDAITAMSSDANMLTKAAVDGKLDTRADVSKHGGDFGKIIDGVNKTLDSVIGPLNVAAEYVDKISKGDIPPKITDIYHGDFNEIKNNLNNCIDIMNGLLAETSKLIHATKEGKLDARGNAKGFTGGWGELVGGVNEMVNAFVGPINVTAEYVERISKGDIPPRITDTYNGDFNEIKNNLNACIDIMNGLLKETDTLIKATQDGKLNTRGNYKDFGGGWSDLVRGINAMIDAFVAPINVTSNYVDRISKGDIPPKITDTYNGDFNTIKNNLNTCIDAVNALITDANMLSKAAVDGKLDTRADASKHGGDYKKIVDGVNKTLDAVIEPVKEASAVLQEMVKGNLQISVVGDYSGDHAVIKNALNETIKSFNEVLSDINSAAVQVTGGAKQVSASSQALSQGSTEQASSIEQLSSSIEEIASQTKQNAVNANQANELAELAKEKAVQGNSQMGEMLKAMEGINEASSNISKIIKVIDEIAFQTNILALNAAVEAARAGQHGKGFAVVAEEVRNLAARSANAAKETTLLIEGSIKKVEGGARLAKETAAALNVIVDGIAKAASLVGDIALASNEQATGIAQINTGILQVSQVTQTNSATSEESAAASQELSSQAELLKEMVSKFKLKNIAASFNNYNELNSDVISMLESMAEKKKKTNYGDSKERRGDFQSPKLKIGLEDRNFGKY